MTCLSIVQAACDRLALARPNAVVTSSDPQVRQMLALLNEEGKSLSQETSWQVLRKQATFTTVATEQQCLLSDVAPGLKFIVNDTIWNRSLRMPVFGPLSPQVWQQQVAMFYKGPWNQFRVFNNAINFIPTPAVGQTCAFEYETRNWTTQDGDSFQSDADTSLIDEDVLTLGLIWRFRQAKGLDFSADLTKYQRQVANLVSRESPKPILNLAGDVFDAVGIPAGNGIIGSNTGFLPPIFR